MVQARPVRSLRGLAIGAAITGLAGLLAACGSSDPATPSPSAPTTSAPSDATATASPSGSVTASVEQSTVTPAQESEAAPPGASGLPSADAPRTDVPSVDHGQPPANDPVAPPAAGTPETPAPDPGQGFDSGSVPDGSPPAAGQTARAPDGIATKLTGIVTAGVESDCVVLTDASGAVLANLIGLDTATTPFGSSVEVSGKFQAGIMTVCMQGDPFEVAAVELK